MKTRLCILCLRPMPHRWWHFSWLYPPFHDPSRDLDCQRTYLERMGVDPDRFT